METYALSFAEKRDWLRLIRTPTIGPVAFSSLLGRYGSASKALEALPTLTRRKSITLPPIEAVEAELAAHEARGIRLIAACEPDYPPLLRALDPAPPILSFWGDLSFLHKPCVAIVGSRNASAIGQRFARQIAGELGEAGLTIVSGLARGIDTSAHHGALETGTAAVLGGGVDHIYPKQNSELFDALTHKGCLVSESPLGHRATARDFPRRNRIISGLSLGVIVIEAAERSGTLITARYALEQNREVMAAPGSPLDPRTKGCNRLIRQGAHLIESAEDIINIINAISPMRYAPRDLFSVSETGPAPLDMRDADRQTIMGVMSPTPTPRDDIIRASCLPVSVASAHLLEMELVGEIFVEADGRISLA